MLDIGLAQNRQYFFLSQILSPVIFLEVTATLKGVPFLPLSSLSILLQFVVRCPNGPAKTKIKGSA